MWSCYILENISRSRSYVGSSTNVNRRLRQHNGNIIGGAASTRVGRPWKLVCYTEVGSKSECLKLEYLIKKEKGIINRLKLLNNISNLNVNLIQKNEHSGNI